MNLVSLVRNCAMPMALLLTLNSPRDAQDNKDVTRQAAFQEIEINNGTLYGPGAQTLLDKCRSSHFILFGEAHGVGGIAELVSATHRSLPADPFYHLVIEAGDWFSKQLANGEIEDILDRNPYSLAFDYDGDLALIEQIKSAGSEREQTVIGVDQEACAIHPFAYLAEESDSYSARQLSKCLTLKALLLAGRYIRSDYQIDLEALRRRIPLDSVDLNLVDSVSDSMKIFVDHVSGRVQQSVERRESRMMNVFDLALQDLLSRHPSSRLIFKMGGAHTVRGVGPNGVLTLGEHVASKADQKGQRSLHINIYPWREGGPIPLPKEFLDHSYVLVDCEKLKKSLDNDSSSIISKDFQKAIGQSDLIILMPRTGQASKSRIRQKQKRFVRTELIKVGLVLIPVLLLLPLYWKSWTKCWRWIQGNHNSESHLGRLPLWISLAMLLLIVFQIGLLIAVPNRATPTSYWIFFTLEILKLVAVGALVISGISTSTNRSVSPSKRMLYWIEIVGCLGLLYFIHAWGLGNLLGI